MVYTNPDDDKKKQQEASKFIFRYLIVKHTSLNQSKIIAITSEQVFEEISEKLPNQGKWGFQAKILITLKNLFFIKDAGTENINESVIVLSDILSSRGEDVNLLTNMQKKIRHTLNFYQKDEKTSKEWKDKDIPFEIKDSIEIEKLLRELDKETCDEVDKMLET